MKLDVLFRDAELAVVNKPAGLPVEADSPESVLAVSARALAPPGGRAWPRVVHRLDRDTSGCLVLALTKRAVSELLLAFEQGTIAKEYLALVQGEPPEAGEFDTPYGQDPRDRRRFTTKLETARRARLSYRVEERLGGAALLRVKLDTGRTHQIRVQFGEAGFPVLGDAVYGVPGPIGRQALHAERLCLELPSQRVDCRAPVPEDLLAALAALRQGQVGFRPG